MKQLPNNTILLFYATFERDTWFKNDHRIKRLVRPLHNAIRHKPNVTGFDVWYMNLVKALRQGGYEVRVNETAVARRNPTYPVGLLGYSSVLNKFDLPNPAILGPGLFDHPTISPRLMQDPRYRKYLITCEWMRHLFAPFYGDTLADWFGGIDTAEWPVSPAENKTVDVLVYDKIRWHREYYKPNLLDSVIQALNCRHLSYRVLGYGQHTRAEYRAALASSRTMIFLCESETQGLAYQEAMASNLPILAWDPGRWDDPQWGKLSPHPIAISSVPYFAPECGEKFAVPDEFEEAFDRFWARRASYTPREFVKRTLSPQRSAAIYAHHYFALASPRAEEPAVRVVR